MGQATNTTTATGQGNTTLRFELCVHASAPDGTWRALLRRLDAADAPVNAFDTPLALVRHLAHLTDTSERPRRGLR